MKFMKPQATLSGVRITWPVIQAAQGLQNKGLETMDHYKPNTTLSQSIHNDIAPLLEKQQHYLHQATARNTRRAYQTKRDSTI